MSSLPAAAPPAPPAPAESPIRVGPVLVAFAIGTLVAVALGAYGRLHTPTGQAINLAGFSSGLAVKSFLATVAIVLAVVQTITAMAMFGRIRLTGAWVAPVHRWSGRLAVAVTVPVAVHCLYALGFQTYDTRTLLHSLFGCFFYGAFVVKMLVLTRDDSPKWALPLLGGLVLTGLTALWMTAALWFYLYS
jgi:Family of unknown function (DUF6529)